MFRLACAPVLLACAAAFMTAQQVMAAPGPPPARYFVSEGGYRNPLLAPDGKHLAVFTALQDGWSMVETVAIIRVHDMKMISAIKMDRFEVPAQLWWVSNSRLVISKARDFGDNERPTPTGELVTANLDGSAQSYLYGYFRREGRDLGFGTVAGLPTVRNNHFYLAETGVNGARSSVYDVDSISGKRTLLLRLDAPGLSILLDHQERPRFASGVSDDGMISFLKYELSEKKWVGDANTTAEDSFIPQAFSADDTALYALAHSKGAPASLVRQILASGELSVVASDPEASVALVSAGRDSTEVFGWTTRLGIPVLHYLDPGAPLAQLHQRLSTQFPGSQVRLLNASDDGAKVLFHVASDRDPGSYYLYDAASSRADLLFARLEQLDPEQMATRRPISFKARDGLRLHGFLTLPKGGSGRQLPMVLLPHGGPHGLADQWYFDADAQFLASRGYAVLQVNFRGSGGRGEDFIKAGYLTWGGAIQSDLIDGVEWTIAEGIADRRRICAYGISFGAYSAMMVAARAPQLFACAIGYAGVYDLAMMLKYDIDSKDTLKYTMHRRYVGDDAEQLRLNSPVFLAAQIKAPVLLIHGSADDVTPVAQGRAMRAALREAGVDPEYLQVSSEGHGFFLPANQEKVYQTLEAFLAKHIGKPAATK